MPIKVEPEFIENNFEVMRDGKLMYKPGSQGGFSRMASPSDFDGTVGSIWTMGAEGLERDEHPFGELEQVVDSHINERSYLEQQLREKADEINDLQDAMDGEDLFGSKKTAAPPSERERLQDAWAVLPIGLISLRGGTNSVLGNMYEWMADGYLTIVEREQGGIRVIAGAGSQPAGTQAELKHDQTGRSKGLVTVIGVVPITPEGFEEAEGIVGKGAVGGYVWK